MNQAYIQKSAANADSANFVNAARRSTAEANSAKVAIAAATGKTNDKQAAKAYRNYQPGAEDRTNAITGQYNAARQKMIGTIQKASTSTGITAAGDIGAGATAMRKKSTGQLGKNAMAGKSSLKAEVEYQSSKSRIPWTQPVTAQNVKTRTSQDKASEDNAKWANRAMRDAEKSMQRAAEEKDVSAYQEAVEKYKRASEAYAQLTAEVIQNENAMQAQADYVRRHASEDQGKALANQRDYSSNSLFFRQR